MILRGLVLERVRLDILRMIPRLNVWQIVPMATIIRLGLDHVLRIVRKALIPMITRELVLLIVLYHHQRLLKKLTINVLKYVLRL